MKNKIKTYGKWFFLSFIWLFVLLFLVDLITKLVCEAYIESGTKIYLIPNFLYVTLTYNTGMAWGLFGGETGRIILTVVSWIASIAIIAVYIWKFKKFNKFWKAMLAMLLAGTLGNLIDRTFYSNGVIDWIGFQFGSYFFPVFNLADSYLVIAIIVIVVYLIVEWIIEYRNEKKNALKEEKAINNDKNHKKPILSQEEIAKLEKKLEEQKVSKELIIDDKEDQKNN